eukprot:6195621-Pleurochrysis_carterae.AAC.2
MGLKTEAVAMGMVVKADEAAAVVAAASVGLEVASASSSVGLARALARAVLKRWRTAVHNLESLRERKGRVELDSLEACSAHDAAERNACGGTQHAKRQPRLVLVPAPAA